MGQNGRKDDVDIRRKRTSSLPCHEVHCPEVSSKAKAVENCRSTIQPIWKRLETIFRTITSANQLSLYGAIAEICEEYETLHDRSGQPVMGGQSSSSFVPRVIKTNVPLDNDDCAHKDLQLPKIWRTNWKVITTRQIEQFLYGCRNPECGCKSDSISWRKILQNSHNSQMQWPVVSTLCQETKKHLNRKVGSEGTPKLGPYWKLQPVACKVNMELISEICLKSKDNSHSWVRISHGLNKLVTNLNNNEQETSEVQF